jgi:small nuclear ribonucleoprotein (snRNP)-like protein
LFSKALISKAIRRRFAVTLKQNEGVFSGVLTEFDRDVYVFEQCQTIPGNDGGTPSPILGRVFVERTNLAYLQDLP